MLGTVAKAYEQGNRNIQTGFSALQIAEASAGQIYEKLQDIYVRAQNAANDINDPKARQALQNEINNFVDAIQKIGTDTEYNGIRLLDGTFAGKFIHYGPRMDQTVNISISDLRAQSLGAFVATGNGATASGTSTTTGGSLTNLLGSGGSLNAASNFILSGTGDYVKISDVEVYKGGTDPLLIDAATLANNINTNESLKALNIEAKAINRSLANTYYDNGTTAIANGTYSYTVNFSDTSSTENYSGTVSTNINLRFYVGDGTKSFDVNLGTLLASVSVTETSATESSATGSGTLSLNLPTLDTLVNRINSAAMVAGAPITAVNDGGKLKLITQNGETIAVEATLNYTETVSATNINMSADVNIDLGQLLEGASTVSGISLTGSGTSSPYTETKYVAAVKVGQIDIGGIDSFKIEYAGVSGTTAGNKGFDFQLSSGANASIQSIKDIKVDTNSKAETALMIVTKALQKADSVRAQIGATMNNLQSIFDSQKVAYDNTKEAESTIRNTDYAKEMSEFTTYQIRMQSTIAMLGQANTLPQLVLQLLR
jgi:flagellin